MAKIWLRFSYICDHCQSVVDVEKFGFVTCPACLGKNYISVPRIWNGASRQPTTPIPAKVGAKGRSGLIKGKFPSLSECEKDVRRGYSDKLTDDEVRIIGTVWAFIEGRIRRIRPALPLRYAR